jgi:hypothetical protein
VPAVSSESSFKIFVSYRRDESAGQAGRLYDTLCTRFGDDQVFFDIESIPLGADFPQEIAKLVASCDALVAVVGPEWLASAGEDGSRRIDDPADFVRLEIEAALQRRIPVVPVLVRRARIPKPRELPEALRALATRNGIELREEAWKADVARLVTGLATIAEAKQPEARPEAPNEAVAESAPRPERSESSEPHDPVELEEVCRSLDLEPMWDGPEEFPSIALTWDGSQVAFATARATTVFIVESQRVIKRVVTGESGHRTRIATIDVAVSDGGFIATTDEIEKRLGLVGGYEWEEDQVSVWGIGTGSRLVRHPVVAGRFPVVGGRFLRFSRDGAQLAFRHSSTEITVWRFASGTPKILAEGAPITDTAFSWDGVRLATAGPDGIRVFDLARGLEAAHIASETRSIAFSPDGRLVAAVDSEKALRLWDTSEGGEVRSFTDSGCDGPMAFSPDGALLATGGIDPTVWEITSARPVAFANTFAEELAFSSDGARLVTASMEEVEVWGLPPR